MSDAGSIANLPGGFRTDSPEFDFEHRDRIYHACKWVGATTFLISDMPRHFRDATDLLRTVLTAEMILLLSSSKIFAAACCTEELETVLFAAFRLEWETRNESIAHDADVHDLFRKLREKLRPETLNLAL
jgi:hypothetical protein